ncbi:unnamed protein product [Diatraea saccharalis]|uniref:Uncharacterized protein n=1 Tax=Diatraea saccharalis TaxID=40085 RepID=A0A9N9WDQ2_9NEOP|nr:unnamed protein product [Diatraea saccharalis]
MKRERRVRIEDPTTLVSINNVKTADVTAKDNNKGLYNFFVDLLETIDGCNAADVEKVTILSTNTSSTKVPLEINESVAQRLELRSQSSNHGCKSPSPIRENNFYCFNNDNEYLASQISPKTSVAKTRKLNKTKKPLHAQSFSVTKKPQSKNIKTESLNLDKKLSNSKKRKKETLLNLFKEQLKMDVNAFDEPQNLYEALKIIAENKRKCQKTIHFEERMKRHRKDSGFPECVFKRPKVLGPGKKRKAAKSIKEDLIIQKQSLIKDNEKGVKRKEVDEDTNGSQYSLKVFGYDYEKPEKQSPMRAKEVVLTYHSSPSISDRGLISDDEYTDSYFNTFSRSLSINGNDYI